MRTLTNDGRALDSRVHNQQLSTCDRRISCLKISCKGKLKPHIVDLPQISGKEHKAPVVRITA